VVASTVRKAASHVAKAFRVHLKPSPLRIEGSVQLQPFAHALFQAFDNIDPAAYGQWAITPKLLQGMFWLAGLGIAMTHDSPITVATKIVIAGFFFAMRSCECMTTPADPRKD
jgi:hypothetical protein